MPPVGNTLRRFLWAAGGGVIFRLAVFNLSSSFFAPFKKATQRRNKTGRGKPSIHVIN